MTSISIKNLAGDLVPITIGDRHQVKWLRRWIALTNCNHEKRIALIRREGNDWKRLSNQDTIQDGDEVGYFIQDHSRIELFRCCNATDDAQIIDTNVWTCWYPPTDERVMSFQFEWCRPTFRNVAGSTISTDIEFATLEDLLLAMQDYTFTANNMSDILHAWDVSC